MITIEKINEIEFKTNKKTSNYYIKEDGGKFVRVRVAEFNKRREDALITETHGIEDYSHFILADIKRLAFVSDCESYELSIHRKQYIRNHIYLSESISRKHGVLFTVTTKRLNGHRLYRFFGNLEDIESAIIEINTVKNEICKITKNNIKVRKLVLNIIAKNRKMYKNIDEIARKFANNRGIATLAM